MDHSPEVQSSQGMFCLPPGVVTQWRNVESALGQTIVSLSAGTRTHLHDCPPAPWKFGYRTPCKNRREARKKADAALLAFHHGLAYCSFLLASANTISAPLPGLIDLYYKPEGIDALLDSPERVARVSEKLASNDQTPNDVRTCLKLVWSTLGEIRLTRNFAGLVVTPHEDYDYESVVDMHNYGVPVHVVWLKGLHSSTYLNNPTHKALDRWCPPLESFTVSTSSQPPATTHPPIQYPAPRPGPPLPDKDSNQYPWLYINNRKAYIESTEPQPLEWKSRSDAASSFSQPGKRGAKVFEFVPVEYHGEQVKRWERNVMTRHEAEQLWEAIDVRQLW